MKRPDSSIERRQLLKKDPSVVADWYSEPDDNDICEPFVRALSDPDGLVRQTAVNALIDLNDMHSSTSIFAVLLNDSVHARKAAALVLGVIGKGDPLAFKYLVRAREDPDESVRVAVDMALTMFTGRVWY